jgi:tetratricopeptide (TPR) repeat protein
MVFALFLAAFFQSAGAKSPDWQSEGLKALEEKRYEAAIEDFTKAAAASPKDYAAHFHLALACSMLKRDAEAIQHYRETLELKPGLYEAELNLGIVLLRQNQAADAVQYLARAAETKPQEFRPRFYEAEALLGSGRPQDAVASYRKALDLNARSAAAESGLARALAAGKQMDESAAHFRRAVELDPAYRDSLLELANLYEQSNRPGDAAKIYEQFPDNPAAQERAARLLIDSGDVKAAIPSLEAAVKVSPTSANRMLLVKAYLREKQSDKAFALLVAAVQADPKDYSLRMLAGRMLRDERKFPEAANQFMSAAQLKQDSVEAWNELSGVLILAERYPEALAALDRVKALGGETASHHYFRAIVLDKLRQVQPAMESYEKFLAMSQGQRPDEEFKARQRVRILKRELSKR